MVWFQVTYWRRSPSGPSPAVRKRNFAQDNSPPSLRFAYVSTIAPQMFCGVPSASLPRRKIGVSPFSPSLMPIMPRRYV